MNFLSKNKRIINIIFVISIVIEFIIAFCINKISQDNFDLFSKHNIVLFVVLILLILIYIVLRILMNTGTAKVQKRRLQKAFQDNGGYDKVVKEMMSCIEKHDYKSIKELKKIVNYIER